MQVSSKVVSLAWTNDGQFLALGLYNGQISIRSRVGEETITIQRNAPVWTLSWSPDKYVLLSCPCLYNLFRTSIAVPLGRSERMSFCSCAFTLGIQRIRGHCYDCKCQLGL